MTIGHLTSDVVLSFLRPGLDALGYEVESGKAAAQKIRRPVLFGFEVASVSLTRSTPSTTISGSWSRLKLGEAPAAMWCTATSSGTSVIVV